MKADLSIIKSWLRDNDHDLELEHKFHPVRKWKFDGAIVKKKIAIEVEGGIWTKGRHITPKGFIKDMEKYNTAAMMGWKILRCEPSNIANLIIYLDEML